MQVYNNAPAFSVWKNYSASVENMKKSMGKLSSGLKIQSAGDDPAGLAMSERMRAQTRNTAASEANVENVISYIQTADSWLQKIHDILGRMAELSVAANDGTKSSTDTANLQQEFTQMQSEIERITSGSTAAAKYNGITLFQSNNVSLQVGPDYGQVFSADALNLTANATTSAGVYTSTGGGVTTVQWGSLISSADLSISVQSVASKAIAMLNVGIDFISQTRAILGAEQSRMNHTLEGLKAYEDNMRAAESRIRDVDVAKETTNFTKYQILTQIGTSMLAQANSLPQNVMKLVG